MPSRSASLPRLRLPGSLRWRLTAFVAAVMLLSSAVAFVVIYVETGNRLQSEIDADLRGDVLQIRASLEPIAPQGDQAVHEAAVRYTSSQPLTATATLLFVLLPGFAPVSNHPEVFASEPPDDGESAAQQRVENLEAVSMRTPRVGYSTHNVPDAGDVRIFELPVRLGHTVAIIGAGEPLAGVRNAQHGITRAFVLAAALSLLLALLASYLAGTSVTAPLRRMAAVAARVDAGELEPRMPRSGPPDSEVRVLADSFNTMLDRLEAAFEAQRGFVADASHELRTPLTVIRGQLEVLASLEHPTEEDIQRTERQVQAEVTRMSRLVDDSAVGVRRTDRLHQTEAHRAGVIRE